MTAAHASYKESIDTEKVKNGYEKNLINRNDNSEIMFYNYDHQGYIHAVRILTERMKSFIANTMKFEPKQLNDITSEMVKNKSNSNTSIPQLTKLEMDSVILTMPSMIQTISNYYPEYSHFVDKYKKMYEDFKNVKSLRLQDVINESCFELSAIRLMESEYNLDAYCYVRDKFVKKFEKYETNQTPMTLKQILEINNFEGKKSMKKNTLQSLPVLSKHDAHQIILPLPTVNQLIEHKYNEFKTKLHEIEKICIRTQNQSPKKLQDILDADKFLMPQKMSNAINLTKQCPKTYSSQRVNPQNRNNSTLYELILQQNMNIIDLHAQLMEFNNFGPGLIKVCLSAMLMTTSTNSFLKQQLLNEIYYNFNSYDELNKLIHLDILVNETLGRMLSKTIPSRINLCKYFEYRFIKCNNQ